MDIWIIKLKVVRVFWVLLLLYNIHTDHLYNTTFSRSLIVIKIYYVCCYNNKLFYIFLLTSTKSKYMIKIQILL